MEQNVEEPEDTHFEKWVCLYVVAALIIGYALGFHQGRKNVIDSLAPAIQKLSNTIRERSEP